MIHTCTKHEPGRACYHHGCRCRDCTDAATRYVLAFDFEALP